MMAGGTKPLLPAYQSSDRATSGSGRSGGVNGAKAPRVAVLVTVGHPANEIVRAAAKADTIVMATMGRTGLGHLLIGSVAEKVVRHSPVPVLTMRAKPGRRAGKRRRG